MSMHDPWLPSTAQDYQDLITKSLDHFGASITVLEHSARDRIEHALGEACGGSTFTLDTRPLKESISFRRSPYLSCTRKTILKEASGMIYALFALAEGEVSNRANGDKYTHAVCICPASGDPPRFYFLPVQWR